MTESEFAAPVEDLTEGRWARFWGLVACGCVLTILLLPPPPHCPLPQTWGTSQCWPCTEPLMSREPEMAVGPFF